jgi:inner membrane protein
MPLPIAHGLVGAGLAAGLHPRPFSGRLRLPLVAGGLLANSPDFDFLLVLLTRDNSWHRGFTHSLAFAAALGLAGLLAFGRAHARAVAAYCAAYASHVLLDFATTKIGGGVELLWPITAERYGLRLFGLSEIPSQLPPGGLLNALLLEVLIFAPPLAAVVLLRKRATRKR